MLSTVREPDQLRLARRGWYRAGVRRRDRVRLSSELRGEVRAAVEAGIASSVLGDDPETAAAAWAAEQGLAGRRLRLLLLVPSIVMAALLAAGALLALLFQAFSNGGDTVLSGLNLVGILGSYLAAGAIAYVAMLVTAGVVLTAVGDQHVRRTVRTLAALLPVGSALCVAGGVFTASELHFRTQPRTFVAVLPVVAVGFVSTIAAARTLAVRHSVSSSVAGDY